jgi:MFS family permease
MANYDLVTYEQEIERHFRWNFIVNALDGGFFGLGMTFVALGTIMPLYLSHLTDSKLALGALAALPSFGYLFPQIFTAPLVERLPRKKPFVIWVSLVVERGPFLALAAGAFFLSLPYPELAIAICLVSLVAHAVGAGVIATAWQEMLAKIIPMRWRGRFFGTMFFSGALMSLPAAAAANVILSRYPYPTNFALCFTITAAILLLSWGWIALTREPPGPVREGVESTWVYVRRLRQIVRTDANFAHYLGSRCIGALGGMFVGFMTVAAVQRFGLHDEVGATYTAFLIGGQLVSNLIVGPLADHKGHKVVLEIAVLCNGGAAALVLLAPTPLFIYPAFVLQGAASAAYMVAGTSITMEFSEPAVRPTYIGLAGTVQGVFSAAGPIFGGWLAGSLGYEFLFGASLGILLLTWSLLRWWVIDPRHASAPA